uniref:hypothetical protein n=1 Tax=Paenibacillus elgii TaxID=189691 RepID=UPI001C3F707C
GRYQARLNQIILQEKAILCKMAFWSKLAVTDSAANRITSDAKFLVGGLKTVLYRIYTFDQ